VSDYRLVRRVGAGSRPIQGGPMTSDAIAIFRNGNENVGTLKAVTA
jgi:hypothetical protein